MTTTTRPRWRRRPDTGKATFKAVAREANAMGLELNAAKQAACAERNGRFWLTDRISKARACSAANLVEVAAFLAARRLTPTPSPATTSHDHPDL